MQEASATLTLQPIQDTGGQEDVGCTAGSYGGPATASFGGHVQGGLKSSLSAVFLLSCLSLGVGVFTLPTVLNKLGWLVGTALILFFGVLSAVLQVQLLDVAVERRCNTWEEVTEIAPGGKVLSRLSLFLSLVIGNAAHLQVVAGMLFDLISFFVTDKYGQKYTPIHKFILLGLFLGVAAPYCFMDDLGSLQHVGKSVAGVVLATCSAVAVCSLWKVGAGHGASGNEATSADVPSFDVIIATAPGICFAFTSMLSFWEVFAALRRGCGESAPKVMRRSLLWSSVMVLVMYLLVAGTTIIAFGNAAGQTKVGNGYGNVLYNFPPDNYPITILCFLLVVVIVLDYPIINFPLVGIFLRMKRFGLESKPFARHFLSLAFMLVVLLIDMLVPDLDDVFGLCGSLGLSVSCFVLPGLVLVCGGRTLDKIAVGAVSAVAGLLMLFGGTFFILKRVIAGKGQ